MTVTMSPGWVPVSEVGRGTVTAAVLRWAREKPDQPAFTFVDYAEDNRGRATTLTWSEVDTRARAIAAGLRARAEPGDRAVLLLPQGLHYVTAFFGCLYAGVLAVPLFPVDGAGHRDRVVGVLGDCTPRAVLTTTALLPATRNELAGPFDVLAVEDLEAAPPTATIAATQADQPAYLQYTSGSTRQPAGVVVTHRNLMINASQALRAYGVVDEVSPVSWLPLFHDMGLVLGMGSPLVFGSETVFMDPLAFLYSPIRWLEAMSGRSAVISAAPNFAYDLCVRRVPEAKRSTLDLTGVLTLANGSEPVRAGTVARFQEAFAPHGLGADVQRPSYGLAEATVYVTAAGGAPVTTSFDRAALAAGHAIAPVAGQPSTALVGCGSPVDQHVLIVDPDSDEPLPDGRVGEIRVTGPNVSPGYWSGERDLGVFGTTVTDQPAGLPRDGWLRTGDLGVRHEGQFYVVSRIKDTIIVDGRNHYPQDIEATVESVDRALRDGHIAAFAVDRNDQERLVVVAERSPRTPREDIDLTRLGALVRAAVSTHHDLRVHDVVLAEPGTVPRTSSGKLSRSLCREQYLEGRFAVTA
ncbi:fatty acyl-AMP ligase [Saccharothrix sp. ALI-22-I]|uniref:fatty acyl-AMP ligase n=1 Tax=Saccharothrix sp. ALI-22-I TaxID=1933778 RepID=UPI001EE6CB75|nr:fatty acyl-AMP ligase [Saccharothrix sp. ALI-22-I]